MSSLDNTAVVPLTEGFGFHARSIVNLRLYRVAALLFCSGACALVYQVAWFRELRLVFGASTAASSAVMAVFMGGLGIGGARLGKRADAAANPLELYAKLEMAVAVLAAVTPFLVRAANAAYLAAGGSSTLGAVGATVLRLVLAALILGPATFLMGGTLPAAARAASHDDDPHRRHVAVLYGTNTMGAVLGAVLANFLLLEVLGTRFTLWAASLLNLLVAVIARSLARKPGTSVSTEPNVGKVGVGGVTSEDVVSGGEADGPSARLSWFPPAAAALVGAAFMLMELTWYRILAPILGGSSYTFGLILAVALAGIGVGGAIYARTRAPATLRSFAATCSLEALFIVIPYALGDRIAIATALLRPFCRLGFLSSVGVWTVVAAFVVLPAAIVSGAQFPLLIALYGRGAKKVGRDVGSAYLANTLGAIGGALAGGFGLLPLLGAVGCWRLVVVALVVAALVAVALDVRHSSSPAGDDRRRMRSLVRVLVGAVGALLLLTAPGPSAFWRHAGIGAGRADARLEPVSRDTLAAFVLQSNRGIFWESDGVESSVALNNSEGYAFIVNGKSDGHATRDGGTQVMGGLLPAMLQPEMRSSLVIGLGTGSTAGWLGQIPAMERVDVVEIEPAILRVARDCTPVNRAVLDNPKVHVQLADAREVLRTVARKYDVIFSEPSNPYRAGTSSLYTVEFYRAAAERLAEGGTFVQWVQAYEVDAWTLATVAKTLRQVFDDITIWEPTHGDFLLLARRGQSPFSVERVRERLREEPFATAARRVWQTDSVEGVFAHFVAQQKLVDALVSADGAGAVNTDDQNLLEFAFARSVGTRRDASADFRALARQLKFDQPIVAGELSPKRVLEERWLFVDSEGGDVSASIALHPEIELGPVLSLYQRRQYREALEAWKRLGRERVAYGESTVVADCAARVGTDEDMARLDVAAPGEREIFKAMAAARRSDGARAVDELTRGFASVRAEPWVRERVLRAALGLAIEIGEKDPRFTRPLFAALKPAFAVDALRDERLMTAARVAAATRDVALCIEALAPLEPPPPDRWLLQTRAACYTKGQHPLAEAAQRALLIEREAADSLGLSLGPARDQADAGAPP